MKRGRRSTLTGGTGDTNPQFLSALIPYNAGTTELSVQLPVTRIPQSGVATIIEVIKIWFDWRDTYVTLDPGNRSQVQEATLGTKSFGTTKNNGVGEPTTFGNFALMQQDSFTAGGTMSAFNNPIQMMDLDDGAGHGVLIATDKMFVQTQMSADAQAPTSGNLAFKMLYRFKSVGVEEYVGIVQSQQS